MSTARLLTAVVSLGLVPALGAAEDSAALCPRVSDREVALVGFTGLAEAGELAACLFDACPQLRVGAAAAAIRLGHARAPDMLKELLSRGAGHEVLWSAVLQAGKPEVWATLAHLAGSCHPQATKLFFRRERIPPEGLEAELERCRLQRSFSARPRAWVSPGAEGARPTPCPPETPVADLGAGLAANRLAVVSLGADGRGPSATLKGADGTRATLTNRCLLETYLAARARGRLAPELLRRALQRSWDAALRDEMAGALLADLGSFPPELREEIAVDLTNEGYSVELRITPPGRGALGVERLEAAIRQGSVESARAVLAGLRCPGSGRPTAPGP